MIRSWLSRALALFRAQRDDGELDEEIRTHLRMAEQAHIARGLSREDARRAARRDFGNLTRVRERYREQRGVPLISSTVQDVRFAARSLRRHSWFSLAAVVTLALGVSSATLAFSVLDQVLCRPLPFDDGQALVTLYQRSGSEYLPLPYRNYLAFRVTLDDDIDLAAFSRTFVTVSDGAFPVLHQGELVSETFFSVLRVQPHLGRVIGQSDNVTPGGHPVVVLSHMLWQSVFGGDPQIIGRPIPLNGHPYEVIGVAPPGFRGAVWPSFRSAFWVPAVMAGQFQGENALTDRHGRFQTVGRMRRPASLGALQARIDPLDATLSPERVPPYVIETGEPWRVAVFPGNYLRLWPEYREPVVRVVQTLVLMTLLALGVACTNLATLLMARWTDRRGELTVCRALGACTVDLVRRLGADIVVLTVAGGVGATVGVVAVSRFVPLLPLGVPYVLDLTPDGRVLLVGLGVLLVSACALGTVPLWQIGREPGGLRTADRTVTGRGLRAMHGLVVVQVAATLVLTFACALLMRSATDVGDLETGFSAEQGLTATLAFSREAVADPDRPVALVSTLLQRLRDSPLVETASASATRPLRVHQPRDVVLLGSRVASLDRPISVRTNQVTPEYFESLGLSHLRGRDFAPADTDDATVAIVSRAFAERYWPGEPVMGRTLRFDGEETTRRIVGVVEDVVAFDVRELPEPTVYTPWSQRRIGWVQINVRTWATGRSLLPLLRAELATLDPTLPLTDINTYGEIRALASRDARVLAGLAAALAGLAVTLAVVGLSGLVGFVMSLRQRELGIRAALGASPSANGGLVVRRAVVLTATGLLIGAAASHAVGTSLEGLLFGVSPRDPMLLLITAMTLATATLAGCWPHARGAARVDPVDVLRSE